MHGTHCGVVVCGGLLVYSLISWWFLSDSLLTLPCILSVFLPVYTLCGFIDDYGEYFLGIEKIM